MLWRIYYVKDRKTERERLPRAQRMKWLAGAYRGRCVLCKQADIGIHRRASAGMVCA